MMIPNGLSYLAFPLLHCQVETPAWQYSYNQYTSVWFLPVSPKRACLVPALSYSTITSRSDAWHRCLATALVPDAQAQILLSAVQPWAGVLTHLELDEMHVPSAIYMARQ